MMKHERLVHRCAGAMSAQSSEWRQSLARSCAPVYAANPKVVAVALTGSSARGCADAYSDIEIAVFWNEGPADYEREAFCGDLGGINWTPYPYDDQYGWSEEFLVHQVKIDVSHRTVDAVEQVWAEVLLENDTSEAKQALLSGLLYAVPLVGAPLLKGWQSRLEHYPDDLARAMVHEHLGFGSLFWLEMLAARRDVLPLYEAFCSLERLILGVLLALNHIYYPGAKWVGRTIAEMHCAPAHLADRLADAFHRDPVEGARILGALVDETLGLVETQQPQIDTGPARLRLEKRRPLWSDAPAGIVQ